MPTTTRLRTRLLALALAAVLLILPLSACGKSVEKSKFYSAYSILEQAKLQTADGAFASASFHGSDGDWIDIVFPKKVRANTLVLSEKGDNITAFQILANINGNLTPIYVQDKIGSFRYCAFEEVTSDTFRLQIDETKDGTFTLQKPDILYARHTREDFRVTTYAIADRLLSPDSIDPKHLSAITDFILFGAVRFDESGKLYYQDFDVDGKTVSGKEVLQTAIQNLHAAQGDNRFNLYINILGPDGTDANDKEKLHNTVFREHADTLCAGIAEMLDTFAPSGVSGVYFDYEYPYKASGWRAFSQFLVTLKSSVGDRKIGTALGPWGGHLSKEAKEAVDLYEIMAYDLFDDDGDHASFATGVDSVNFMLDKGYDLQKSALGLPFYGRPADGAAIWTDYSEAAERLGRYSNRDDAPIDVTVWENGQNVTKTIDTPRYLNSCQMVYDKTAFAYDCGLGGVMIWHYSCDAKVDTGLSLFEAIGDAVQSRTA